EQANINSNYVELEIEAEFADAVMFGKDEATKREVSVNGITKIHYFYEAKELKAGSNTLKFTVISGEEKQTGSLILFNSNTPVSGAQFKTVLKSKIAAFNGLVQLSFPKGTNFMRNDSDAVDSFLSSERRILFGIANNTDGRVDKYKHPATYDGQTGNPNQTIIADAKFLLIEPTGRFRPAGQLIWIDAGTISNAETDLNKVNTGSGRLPYDEVTFYNRALEDLVVPSQPGQLKLKYDPVLRDTASRYLTVYHYDIFEDSTGVVKARWRNMGGVVDPKSKTITVPLETFGYYQVMYMDNSFDDVNSHPWARNILDTLYSKGIMAPKSPPAAFGPNDPIGRGEFTTMLVKIFDIPLHYTEDPTFTDVLRTDPSGTALYDYKYIETAAAAGIVRGSGGGKFQPDSTIRRQDAAVMIAKAANLKMNTDDVKILKALQKSFTDANAMDNYTIAAIEAVTKAGLMSGKENTLVAGTKASFRFDPLDSMTRAEAGAIAISILKQQKKIPK
ncbi:MAG TPA: S-layer homology domain-containing protein, partial [Bacilli bacterium]